MPSTKSLRGRLPASRDHGPKSKIQLVLEACDPKVAAELIEILDDESVQSAQIASLVNSIARDDLGWSDFKVGGSNVARVRRERRYWS
jgi:hypothetical protein